MVVERDFVTELKGPAQAMYLEAHEFNLRLAGDGNRFRPIRNFRVLTHLLFEERNGRVSQIVGINRKEGYIWAKVMNTGSHGRHLEQWTFNHFVRVPKNYGEEGNIIPRGVDYP